MSQLFNISQNLLEKNLLPDFLIRQGMRRLLTKKLRDEASLNLESKQDSLMEFINFLKSSPIAVQTKSANEQHYEVPTEFFRLVLGKHMKYSSCYWDEGMDSLDQAEKRMLELTLQRAGLANGHSILELGCGWGSLSLYMAQRLPKSHIVGVSNSRTQKEYIDAQSKKRGLKNVEIITADMNEFKISAKFDRIVSVEMFEHMRNYQKLLEKAASFLRSDGKLFIHIFTHREYAYLYDEKDDLDWIAKYFFTGGIMPSDHLLLYFQEHFQIEEHWRVNGTHYQKTAEYWLKNMDINRDKIIPILQKTYGLSDYKKWWVYWRVFFMSCAELWGYDRGNEWFVSHYRFKKR